MLLKFLIAILMVSCSAGCISTQHYQEDILGRWMFTDAKYSSGIEYSAGIDFLENGICYRLNSDLSRGAICQYEMRGNIINVPTGECISNGKQTTYCSSWEYHYLPAQNGLSFVVPERRLKVFPLLKKMDY